MAGAGFKDFAVGEILTASDVDTYLMQQSVMRFADAAARGSALGTAVGAGTALAEGMVSYLDDVNAVQVYNGTGWTSPVPGIGSNVVQTVKTDTFSTTSATLTDVTGLTASITPTSNTSKILVHAMVSCANWAPQRAGLTITRGATNLFVPTSPGSRQTLPAWFTLNALASSDQQLFLWSFSFLDSPATTSSTEYRVRAAVESGATLYVNRTAADTNNLSNSRGVSIVQLIEVAA